MADRETTIVIEGIAPDELTDGELNRIGRQVAGVISNDVDQSRIASGRGLDHDDIAPLSVSVET